MNREAILREVIYKKVGELVWEMRCLDRGWHTFEVVWSDDNGMTKLTSVFSRLHLESELQGVTSESILCALNEGRTLASVA